MKRKGNLLRALLVMLCGSSVVHGDQYWIAYEGNDFPENEGWERHYYKPEPSTRTLGDGMLQLDSSHNQSTYDFYQIHRQINPTIFGESFVAEWRVVVPFLESPFGFGDSGIGFARDGGGTLSFSFLTDRIMSDREGWSIPLSPGVLHDYRITSTDMVTYALEIDGVFARNGTWDLNSLNESFVGWGDTTQGGGILSVSRWDFVRFGVIPEPATVTLCWYALWISRKHRHQNRSTKCAS